MKRNTDEPKLTTRKALEILEKPVFGDPEQIRAHKFLELRNEAVQLAGCASWESGGITYDLKFIDEDTLEKLLHEIKAQEY